jgi:hypothetical protein
VDARGGQNGLTLDSPHQLRSGGGAVSAGTVGDGDREESVGRVNAYFDTGRLRHCGYTPDIHHRATNSTPKRTMTSAAAAHCNQSLTQISD